MMIENWCNAVSGRTNESVCNENDLERSETVSSDINMANEFDDVCQMGQYEFLFFIPLQYMAGLRSDDVVDMIKELTRHLTSDTDLIDRIFQEDSMRCLIIIDSLDEWRPPKDVVRRPHVSYGIPNGDRAKDATVLTLSRPSAKGILNLKNSEIDHKLHLLGICISSLKPFIERYISKTASTQKSYNEFITIIKRKQVGHIEKTPLLLQQILWLYCYGIDMEIGKSVSKTYCQILNIMCGWSDHKVDGNDVRNEVIGDENIFLPENMQIPRFSKRVLFLMGATAFDILTSGSIRNIFGRQHLLENGLFVDDVTKLLKFGILKESNCFDPTQEDTQFSFIHMSYLEFFAALYVTSNDNTKETKCLREKGDEKQEVLEKLFGTCKSASDILQLSNVIKMVCGLSPILIGDLSKRISCIVNEDVHILYLRRHGYKMSFRNDEIIQIQRLMVECLKECGSFDNTMISISDLCINDIEPSIPLQRINTNDVISLSFEDITRKHVVDYITQCKQLQHVYIKHVSFSYEELSFLSQIECVKQLTLRGVKVEDTLQPGIIDLSSQKQLQILELISCMNIRISYLVTEHLEQVYIKDCPNVLDFKLLSNAIRLTDVYIEAYYRNWETYHQHHIIDMSRQNHLRKLTIVNNPGIEITGLNFEQLEEVNIQYIYECNNSKDQKLLSYSSKNMELHVKNHTTSEIALIPLLQKTTLRQVTLDNVKCDQEKHLNIDLSGHNYLQKLTLIKCPGIVITGLNTEQLEEVNIQYRYEYNNSKDTKLLSYASKNMVLYVKNLTISEATLIPLLQKTTLRQVTLDNVKCDQEKHLYIDLSGQNHLQKLTLIKCPGIVITGLNTEQLEHLLIDNDNHYLHSNATLPALEFELPSSARKLINLYLCGQTVNTKTLEILQQKTLRQLNMIHVSGDQHDIHVDLSKLKHLQILKLSDCKNIKISGINTEQLESVHIINCKCVFDFDLSSNASKLSEINLKCLTGNMASLVLLVEHAPLRHLALINVSHCQPKVEGQTHEIHVDLSKQNHLQILKMSDCKQIKISYLNTEELKEVHISKCKCLFDFDVLSNACKLSEIHLEGLTGNMASLVSLAEHASVRQLTLIGVTHCQSGVEGKMPEIDADLSKQNHLQILKLSDCKQIKVIGLNTDELKEVHISKCKCLFVFDILSKASKLRKICLEGLTGNMASLFSLVEHSSLRELTLKGVTHCQSDVEGHMHEMHADLSKLNNLQTLKLSDCKEIKISGLNIEELKEVHISKCLFDFDILSNARKLSKIHLEYLTGNMASLVSLVEQASLRHLALIGVTHYQSEVEGQMHKIHVDLSKQNLLEELELSDCQNMKISDLNSEYLHWVHIGQFPDISNINLLANARELSTLWFTGKKIGDRYQFRKHEGYVIHSLHRLRTLKLQNVDIDAYALTLIPEMFFLKNIFLEDTNMSIYTWRAFVDSILTLQQSVIIEVFDSRSFLNEEQIVKHRYVKNNTLFKMTQDKGALCFCFQRREPE
ncbi:uncharacterized protein LOC132719483 [Ruditapes philippinarum]|uniref:uncharacterized protein LOC132719483 n=1 Tax=Ruditapes philippinarum TaxID=129788 RepID=UPI00295BC0E8|nr:uncharacterized protein LOC132719483 [Ruditapes philippinarum]